MEDIFQIKVDNILENLLFFMRSEKNHNDNNLYKVEIESLTNLLTDLGYDLGEDLINDFDLKEAFMCDFKLLDKYKEYYKIIKLFANMGIILDFLGEEYNNLFLSDKEAVELSYDFFNQYGNFFSKPLNELKQSINSRLQFVDNLKQSKTYFVDKHNESYMLIDNDHTICKPIFVVHELEHHIDNNKRHDFKTNYLIRETASLFMEIIACDYFQNKFNISDDGNKRRRELHTIIKANAIDIYLKTQLLYISKMHINMEEKELIDIITNKIHINKQGINILMQRSLDMDYFYEISYLIAIELYQIYQYDAERAIYILKSIITNGNNENIFYLLNNYDIKVSNNVLKYEKKLFS